MLAIIVAAGLSPQTGAVPAQGNCEYNQCVGNTGLPWWVFAAIAIFIVAALAAALVLLSRRRRRPPPSGFGPAEGAAGPTAGAIGGTTPPAAGAPEYLETPYDVGGAPPPPPPPTGASAAAGGAGAAVGAGAVAAEEEPDIDSLMAELDKISGEILKRPKTAAEKKPPPEE